MFVRFMFAVVAIVCVLFASPAWPPGVALDWTVLSTTPNVRFTLDKKEWVPVAQGMKIPNKSWIDTGPRGRVTLNRGADTINLSPGTYAGVFNLTGPIEKTVVIQQSGAVSLNVSKKSEPWMMVKSPYLVALVKGTKFEVNISEQQALVSVDRGTVQVTDFKWGDHADINAGQSAIVDPTGVQSMVVAVTTAVSTVVKAAKAPDFSISDAEKKAIAASNAVRDALSNWEGGKDFANVDVYTIAKRSNVYFTGGSKNIFAKLDFLMLALVIIPLMIEFAIRLIRGLGLLGNIRFTRGG